VAETPENSEPQSPTLSIVSSVGGQALRKRNSRPKNYLISWDKIDLEATKTSIPLSGNKRNSSQVNQVNGSSILRFSSGLATRMFYIIFRLLYAGAKFLTRRFSDIRERFRS
jgi:hypothetical protein